jgi:hypothetical protein
MFPAKKGDAFLIRLDNEKNILIDMGYKTTYKDYILNRLIAIRNEGQCIDLLIITHIDEDHIQGAIEFFKDNGRADMPELIEVKEVWHNSFRHLNFNKVKGLKLTDFEETQLENIKCCNSSVDGDAEINEDRSISAEQGSTLAGYLYALGYNKTRWNNLFNGESVNLDIKKKVKLDEISIYILSPDTKKLQVLYDIWTKELKKIDCDFTICDSELFDDAHEMFIKKIKPTLDINENQNISSSSKNFRDYLERDLVQNEQDNSESNGSSIAFILEYKGKKCLFLGDAQEDVVIRSLDDYRNSGENMNFDVVKTSHHGSLKNNFKWLENIKAKKYLISTNGKKHNHPDSEVLAKILKNNDDKKEIYFNYPLDICYDIDNEMLREMYNYSVIYGKNNESIKIEV